MSAFSSYDLIIGASIIIILSFLFGEISRKTNVPAVLMLIVLGIFLKLGLDSMGQGGIDFFPILEVLGIVGLIMIVLEAALELELKQEKIGEIVKAMVIALVGLLASAWAAAYILFKMVPDITSMEVAWMYATPLSILSSAIIIPSVNGLKPAKKEFHIYESTFSDILGIMLFYYLAAPFENGGDHGGGLVGFFGNLFLTIAIAFIASYALVIIFQKIKTHAKLFLLISVLLLVYALAKKMHLSSLIIILIFGLLIANMSLFFRGPLAKYLHLEKAKHIYEGLHVVTLETAFVVRTFFFVIFGVTISLASLLSLDVAILSLMILASIYIIRYVILRLTLGSDILPQLFIAPRGLITVLLFYAIPKAAEVPNFEKGILLFTIIGTSLVMTAVLIWDKNRTGKAINKAKSTPVEDKKWVVPEIEVSNSNGHS